MVPISVAASAVVGTYGAVLNRLNDTRIGVAAYLAKATTFPAFAARSEFCFCFAKDRTKSFMKL